MNIKNRLLLALLVPLLLLAGDARAGYLRGGHYTLDEFYAAIRAVEDLNPDLVTIEEFGQSVKGRPLLVIRIARPDGKERSEVLLTGNVHADEFAGGRVALSIAERLAGDAGRDAWIDSLLDKMDFYVAPLMNPDGYAKASKHLDYNFTMARDNQRHVDLNRNWPYPREAAKNLSGMVAGGSNFVLHPNYRGPHPLSEPENRALNDLVKDRRFFLIIDFHTTGGHFSYAWSYTGERPPNAEVFQAMGEEMVKRQGHYPYSVHQSFDWYQIVGASKDWFYGEYGALALTVEVGKPSMFDKSKIGLIRLMNPFWGANPLDLDAWILNDRDPSLYAIEKGYELTGGKPAQPLDMDWVME